MTPRPKKSVRPKKPSPHRLKYFRRVFEVIREKSDVKFCTGAQIADWFLAAGPPAP